MIRVMVRGDNPINMELVACIQKKGRPDVTQTFNHLRSLIHENSQ